MNSRISVPTSLLKSELEINERLYIRTLHLHDDEDDGSDGDGREYHPAFLQNAHATILPFVWNPVREKGECHEQKDIFIGCKDIGKNRGIEFRKHLSEHDPHSLEIPAAEEKPCEAEDMESDEH